MTINIPENVNHIIKTLQAGGYKAYIVGGCVRDTIMGKKPSDWDICTSSLPEETLSCLKTENIIQNGIKHGTVTVRINQENYEITTFRIDGEYSDNRHPQSVTFVRNLQDDLSRRDFTVNALAYNLSDGLQDYFGGENDIKNRIIRCVGNPDKRFGEDALRILRALRFSSKLGFDIDKKTSESIHKNAYLLKNISAERIMSELVKILTGQNVEKVLLEYPDVLAVFIPEIKPMIGFQQHNPHHIYDVWTHTVKTVSSIPPDKVLRLAALFHDMGKPLSFTMDGKKVGHFHGHPDKSEKIAENTLKKLKSDKKTIISVCKLVKMHDIRSEPTPKNIRRMIAKTGVEMFPLLIELKRADAKAQNPKLLADKLKYTDILEEIYHQEIKKNNDFTLKTLAVNGNDLKEIGFTDGKEMGLCLKRLLSLVIDGELKNEYQELKKAAQKIKKGIY